MNDRIFVFGERTARHLTWSLAGLLSAGTLALMLLAIVGWRASRMGASLSFMGLAVGGALGLLVGTRLLPARWGQADRVLLLVLALLLLPLAVLPVQSGGEVFLARRGWGAVGLQALCALPLGALGLLGLAMLPSPSPGERRWPWVLSGVALGALVAFVALGLLRLLPGAFLMNLFAAPLLWPATPRAGEHSLLARMMLTLLVVLSAAFLILLPSAR